MATVTLSPRYEVEIPREVRQRLGLEPGARLQVFEYAGRIELVPVRSIAELRGFLKSLDPDPHREPDRA